MQQLLLFGVVEVESSRIGKRRRQAQAGGAESKEDEDGKPSCVVWSRRT